MTQECNVKKGLTFTESETSRFRVQFGIDGQDVRERCTDVHPSLCLGGRPSKDDSKVHITPPHGYTPPVRTPPRSEGPSQVS